MKPERWQQVKSVLDQTLDQEPGERVAFVTRACRGDDDLLHEVESYLRSVQEVEEGFLEQPAVVLPERESLPEGHAIGPYRVVREIGRGGMGTVYLAERADQEFEQRAAIKLVKRGMDTDEIVRRFRYERQILAQLEHPNIARLLDGGSTPDGLSYLVMEYVEGRPIDVYCRENDLPERARLELFRTVCAAVHFAHQRLVVHRDLKPGNILVTADRDPKLLDFGIAKLLDPAAHPFKTLAGIQPLTPEYASPEQLKGEAIGTPSDVYSLGVLLHLLLAGELPAPGRRKTGEKPDTTTGPTAAASSGTGSGRPGRRTVKVKGELGTIVAKAMHEEPARRYPSAEQLAEDIKRYLTGFPVKAKPDSFGYRTSKFVRRYPWQVAAAAAVLGLILTSTATATVLYRRAERERVRAEEARELAESERQRSQASLTFLEELFDNADPAQTQGRVITVRDALDVGREKLESDTQLSEKDRASYRDIMGRVYRRIGMLPASQELHQAALRERERIYGGDHLLVAESLHNLATTYRHLGDLKAAEPLILRAVEIQRRRLGPGHPDTLAGLNNYASFLQDKGDVKGVKALYREILEAKRRLYSGGDLSLAVTLNNFGKFLQKSGEKAAAEPLYRESLEIRRRLAQGRPDPDVARSASNLATLLEDRGATAEAEALHREALTVRRQLHPTGHADLVRSLNNFGMFLDSIGKTAEAKRHLEEAHRWANQVEMSPYERHLLQSNLGAVLLRSGETARAEPLLRQARAGLNPESWRYADATSLLGACLAALGRRSEAEPLLREGVERFSAAEKLPDDDAHQAAEKARARWAEFQKSGLRPIVAAGTPPS